MADPRGKTFALEGGRRAKLAMAAPSLSAAPLAVELLLFEFRSRSIIPVALAASAATAVRLGFDGVKPVFAMPTSRSSPRCNPSARRRFWEVAPTLIWCRAS